MSLVKTTSQLVLLQLVSRAFSFSLNQLLLRFTSPQALGVATIGLDVVRDTSLFLVREGLRGAVVRTRDGREASKGTPIVSQRLRQTLFLPVYLSPFIPLCFFLYSLIPPTPFPPHFRLAVALYALSGVIELFAERAYLVTLLHWESLTGLRVKVEGVAVAAKSVATLAAFLLLRPDFALVAYAVGQVVYATALWIGLARYATQPSLTDPSPDHRRQLLDPEVTSMAWSLTKQSLVKQLLTEGDKIAVGRLSTTDNQGGYAVALNYGSLVARIVFQPLEESSRLFYSRQLSSTKPSAASLVSTANLLCSLLLLHSHLSLVFIFLAPSFTAPLLFRLLGPRWSYPASSAPTILKAYCYYLPSLAFNGITEAFFQSVATGSTLAQGNYWLATSSLVFISSFALLRYAMPATWVSQEEALVYANAFAMLIRIGFSGTFIRSYYRLHPEAARALAPARWAPKLPTLAAFACSGYLVRWSEARGAWRFWRGFAEHLGLGTLLGIGCLTVCYWQEREAAIRLREAMGRSKKVD